MKKISIIIFTYKRAILLNEVLRSIFKNFKNIDLPIHVIYHFDQKHKKSYDILKKVWKGKKVIFYERKKINILNIIKYFFINPLNILWVLRWPSILKDLNNFKFLLEKILRDISNDFITLVPDDQIFYKKTIVPDKALKIINRNKNKYFYRFFTGDHFRHYNSLPKKLKKKYHKDKFTPFFEWSSVGKLHSNSPLWTYRFTIEGTIYSKQALMNLIRVFLYHNPITLEAIGLWESRFRGFFSNGISAKNRTAAGYQLNSVQNLVKHPNHDFKPDILMKAYLKGYNLIVSLKDFNKDKFDVVPKVIYFKKNNKIIRYEDIIL